MNVSTPIVGALLGVIVLFFGRKLFWLCVAAVGFAAGVELAPHIATQPSTLLALSFALVLGFLGALLAIFLQKVAVAIVGFLGGGKLVTAFAATFLVSYAHYSAIIFLIGGVVGALLLLVLFDWALIVLSSAIGAYLIIGALHLPATGQAVVFAGLTLIGVIIQALALSRARPGVPS